MSLQLEQSPVIRKGAEQGKKTLPKSPGKKTAVLKWLVAEVIGPDIQISSVTTVNKPKKSLSNEDIMLIESFYSRDDISRQAPGKQDVKSVKNSHTGKRELIQKRHMVLTIGEAYQEFNKCYPDTEVGKP